MKDQVKEIYNFFLIIKKKLIKTSAQQSQQHPLDYEKKVQFQIQSTKKK